MAQLSPQEEQEYIWGQEIKHFLESDAYTQYAYPKLMETLSAEFPDPKSDDWQNAYIKAYALTQAAATMASLFASLSSRSDQLQRKSQAEVPNVDLA